MPVFICQGCGSEHSSWSGKCPHCGVSETIQLKQSTDRMIEKVIKGKYKIVRKLGQGGMGAVYLAEQVGIGHRVALKFLKSEFSEDAEIARRFLNEAKSYARVAHPNAVTLHDFGQDDEGNLFIAMEYCEGVDLKKILQEQKRIPLGEAIDIILQVADVLGNAHSKQVVHRDLKPENIMLRKGMRGLHVKVLDFGIARLMNEGTKLTMQGAIAGTPRYMAPEQVEGRDDVDHRADIYAVGILLYEMITGVQPFDGTTITEILRNQVVQPMPRLTNVSADLDYPEVEAVLQKACSKSRNDRFPDMQAFAHQIAQAMPTQAGKPGTGVWAGMQSSNDAPAAPTKLNAAAEEASTMQATFVRSGTEIQHPIKPAGKPAGGPSFATPAPNLSIGAISPSGSPVANSTVPAQDLSLLTQPPPRSNGPMIALGVVVLLALGGGGAYLFSNRGPGPDVLVPPPPVVRDPVVVKNPDPPPVVKPPEGTLSAAEQELLNLRGRDTLARALTEFKQGNLEACNLLLEDVPPASASRAEAEGVKKKIDEINDKIARGAAAFQTGNCDAAVGFYKQALKLNPAVAAANRGVAGCKAAALPTTFDP